MLSLDDLCACCWFVLNMTRRGRRMITWWRVRQRRRVSRMQNRRTNRQTNKSNRNVQYEDDDNNKCLAIKKPSVCFLLKRKATKIMNQSVHSLHKDSCGWAQVRAQFKSNKQGRLGHRVHYCRASNKRKHLVLTISCPSNLFLNSTRRYS